MFRYWLQGGRITVGFLGGAQIDKYANLNTVILPSWTVHAIACVPGGAHPSYAQGYYKRDNAYSKKWDAISRDRDGFLAWMTANVLEKGPDVFAAQRQRLAGVAA